LGTVIANRDRPAIARPDWADGAEIIALLVLAVVLIFLTRWTYVGIISSIVVVGICFLYLSMSTRIMLGSLTLLPSLLRSCACFLHAYGVKFVSEFLQNNKLKTVWIIC
jgi:CHASE2 domain-containing sensor protein